MQKTLRNLVLGLLLLIGKAAAATPTTAIYVSGHPDDWQLFMNPDAYQDLTSPDTRVVFIYLTSGDQDLREGGQGTMPLYLARENGALRSTSFASNLAQSDSSRLNSLHPSESVLINQHRVTRYGYKNAVHYFLRLPDVANWQSITYLDQFHRRPLPLRTIDGTTTYTNWADLQATVRAIIVAESHGARNFRLNALDPDVRYNPEDHPDHRNAGSIAVEACHGLKARIKLFQGYATGLYPENLTEEEKLNESALFALAASASTEAGYENTWEYWHKGFIGKNYYRLYFDPGSLQASGLPSFDGIPVTQGTASSFSLEYIALPGHSDADQNMVMQAFDRASELISYHKRHFNNMHLAIYASLLLGGFFLGLLVMKRRYAPVATPVLRHANA
ncbi:PIG-L family deacetylase [Hymenobacter cellulosilyticus]|uniref:PIG-L family deacetylase n=1 Tax=Hymenobacter cellulosilyticus TaxID=2932248 RepID=A0A8T9QGZ1_9BACT|nr:PIG-L family deacetylase [Hymenobacter cellulosilyticus]UOQ74073.1 PIG-L family deacetylase [Hymenobacter cellulosilyticus]